MRGSSLQLREVAVTVAVDGGGAAVCDLVTHSPAAGLAEQQPEEIWRAVLAATRSALDHSPAPDRIEVSAEPTLVVWDQESLGAARPAIAPSDVRASSGGVPAALRWLAGHDLHTWALVSAGRYAVGTVESYVVARMTRGTWFATDREHAGRTGLLDTATGQWDTRLCEELGVPPEALPEVLDPHESAGTTDPACFLDLSLPIRFR
jgi:glycerol kinase